RAARPRELLPLRALPASYGQRCVGAGASVSGLVPDRRRRGEAPDVEAAERRRREMVLRRVRLGDVRSEPEPSRATRHPDGHVRRRPPDQTERSAVRRVRGGMGARSRPPPPALPREPPCTGSEARMSASVPTFQLLVWIARRPRSYAETAAAWMTYASRLATWQAARDAGLVEIDSDHVVLTAAGASLLTAAIWRAA